MSAAGPVSPAPPRLSRPGGYGRPAAPVRIVHLGLGNFFRAHQAWYTEHAPDAAGWGIAAFTGRSAALAEALAPQEGLYTLITRGAGGDGFEVISSLSAVHPAADHDAWLRSWRSPALAVATLTVTEAGYLRTATGGLDGSRPDVRADVAALRSDPAAPVGTAPGRLVSGFLARRAAGVGPVAVVPCDNLPENGSALATVVADLVALVDPSLAAWVGDHVSFASTMVDRITPATTDEDRAAVLAVTGVVDAAPVPTEPFSEWVIQGGFPAGRPAWDGAGARFAQDVVPFEQRKLRLLNGAHSLLAYAGSILGHATVAEAVADPLCRGWVEEWWDEASAHLPLAAEEVVAYRAALLARWANPNIRHALAQIAADGSQKVPVRVLPTLRAERAAGRVPPGAVRIIAAWTAHLRGLGAPITDARAAEVAPFGQGSIAQSTAAVLAFLDPDLPDDFELRAAVIADVQDFAARAAAVATHGAARPPH